MQRLVIILLVTLLLLCLVSRGEPDRGGALISEFLVPKTRREPRLGFLRLCGMKRLRATPELMQMRDEVTALCSTRQGRTVKIYSGEVEASGNQSTQSPAGLTRRFLSSTWALVLAISSRNADTTLKLCGKTLREWAARGPFATTAILSWPATTIPLAIIKVKSHIEQTHSTPLLFIFMFSLFLCRDQ